MIDDTIVLTRHRLWPRLSALCGVALVMAGAALSGCASSGNVSIAEATSESVSAQIQKGRTSQADVRRLYGDPMKTSFSANGLEQWEYEFTRLQSKPTNFIPYVSLVHSGAEGEKRSLVLLFDKNKNVQDYSMNTSKVDVSQGILAR